MDSGIWISGVCNMYEKSIDLNKYETYAEKHEHIEDLRDIEKEEAEKFLNIGTRTDCVDRSGTFIQKDSSVLHNSSKHEGVEITDIIEASNKYSWLDEYMWKHISASQDELSERVSKNTHGGYFIRALPGVKIKTPLQACLYIKKNNFSQHVHNIVILEEGAELNIITGCATSSHITSGLHLGISEFYIKKGAKLIFTMIHEWGKDINVRPKTAVVVEEDGVFVSNFISLGTVGSLKMFPTAYLVGKNAAARSNSIIIADKETSLDVGSRVVLEKENTKAEIISRAITLGGNITARGDLVGKAKNIKAHLECKGLILDKGIIHAIPELSGYVPGVEMSHEAAVGKIDRHEIEYLMARGLDEEEAISAIVKGFLNIKIEGLPENLNRRIEEVISRTEKDII